MKKLPLFLTALIAAAVPAAASAKSPTVKVMTRNLYLGADLSPGTSATSLQALVDGAGTILKQVDANDFPVRAKGLAAEIRSQKPDLVGMQEVALWRTAPCTENPLPPKATTVKYDYLALLMKSLGKGYRVAIAQPEFDFEVYADTDGNPASSAPGCPLGSEINGRLTMRDVILAKRGVKTSKAKGAHYKTLLQEKPGGVPVNVTRGWTRVDAKVRGVRKFRFVNTHLEAFDSTPANLTNTGLTLSKGEVREAQAKELFARGGPATGRLPVVLAGDLNSDKSTVQDGDRLAYEALRKGGFVERSTYHPLGCCLNANVLSSTGGGKISDFDHKVDHVMTSAPKVVKLVRSGITGRSPVNGFWDSDHAGLWSLLRIR
jgi:endonuclease/exonuclease/phosphatase family metal-dependent hydrolase